MRKTKEIFAFMAHSCCYGGEKLFKVYNISARISKVIRNALDDLEIACIHFTQDCFGI